MKAKGWMAVILLIMGSQTVMAQEHVTNIRAKQEDKVVTIKYDLQVRSDVKLFVSLDDGETYTDTMKMTGNVNKNVPAGKNKIIRWQAFKDLGYADYPEIRFKFVTEEQQPSASQHVSSFRIQFLLGANYYWYSLSTKEGYQQMIFPESVFPHQDYHGISVFPHIDFSCFRFTDVKVKVISGFTIGLGMGKKLGKKTDLLVSPTSTLTSLFVQYETELLNHDGQVLDTLICSSNESIASFLECPVLVQYQLIDHSFYLIGGLNPKYYLASLQTRINMNGYPTCLQTNRFDLSLDFGFRYRIYKHLGVQVKMSLGLLNAVKGQEEQMEEVSFYNLPISSARRNQLQVMLILF